MEVSGGWGVTGDWEARGGVWVPAGLSVGFWPLGGLKLPLDRGSLLEVTGGLEGLASEAGEGTGLRI